jgi:type II secretory pathway pseudopilin PulG
MENKSAFTLAELAVTAVIFGLLAMMAIPNMTKTTNKSQIKSAYKNLLILHSTQQSYAARNGYFYVGPSSNTIDENQNYEINDSSDLNNNLNINIMPAGATYSCYYDSTKWISERYFCQAALSGGMILRVALFQDIESTHKPSYCANDGFFTTQNPCCRPTSISLQGNPCP